MNILGIESSCDETSVAIISNGNLKVNLISSQDFHVKYGGVVPELSSRAHLQMIIPLLRQALKETNLELGNIDIISATAGPGLIGALLVGLTFAESLSFALQKPFIPVNHIEGHIFSGFLMEGKPEFPFLCLVVSGGHTLLLIVKNETEIVKLGTTVDDAAGEAFDKVAKMLGLGYPGGPKIQKLAAVGNPAKIKFPIAKLHNKFDFSFSGLKTSVLRFLQKEYGTNISIPDNDLPDIAASFEYAITKALTMNVQKALDEYSVNTISLVGGVAANESIRNEFYEIGKKYNKQVVIPSLQYCGDNAAMIALRGFQIFNTQKHFELNTQAFPSLQYGDLEFWKDTV